jgi:Permease for cytosine/purines, uracil, thiamine, allantoin
LRTQSRGSYNIFAFWMSDVHSVGGYVTAGSLFVLGLGSWQVLVALLIGIGIVNVFCNLVAKPSQQIGVPYPVICRSVFGVLGANVLTFAIATVGIQHRGQHHLTGLRLLQREPAKDQLAGRRDDRGGRLGADHSVETCTTTPEVIHYTLETLGAFIGPLC